MTEFTSYDVRWQDTAGGPIQVYVAQAPRDKLDDLLRRAIGVEDLDSVPFLEVWGNHQSGNVHVIRDGGKTPQHSYVIRNKGILAIGSATLLALVNAAAVRKSGAKQAAPVAKAPINPFARKDGDKKKEDKDEGSDLFKFEFVCNVTHTKPKELS